jgi:hypothetical protein
MLLPPPLYSSLPLSRLGTQVKAVELDVVMNLHASAAALGHWVPEGRYDSDGKLSEGDGPLAAEGSACEAVVRRPAVGPGLGASSTPRDCVEVRDEAWGCVACHPVPCRVMWSEAAGASVGCGLWAVGCGLWVVGC